MRNCCNSQLKHILRLQTSSIDQSETKLTFQSRYTSRAKIRTPARTAASMIHKGTTPCCATVLSGDTVTLTWQKTEEGGKQSVTEPFLW